MLEDLFLPRKYFIVKGVGLSRRSLLNAFDKALMDAGIGEYNIVPVSSILPENSIELENPVKFKPGTVVFVVMSRIDGVGKTRIGAGIGIARVVRDDGVTYGFVVEGHGNGGEEELYNDLKMKLEGMAEVRRTRIVDMKIETRYLDVPEGYYGSVIVSVVFAPPYY